MTGSIVWCSQLRFAVLLSLFCPALSYPAHGVDDLLHPIALSVHLDCYQVILPTLPPPLFFF